MGDVVTSPVFELSDVGSVPGFRVQPVAKISVEGNPVVLTATAPDGYVVSKWRRIPSGSASRLLELESDGGVAATTANLTLGFAAATGYFQAVAVPVSETGA
jgi:hypothetical protein